MFAMKQTLDTLKQIISFFLVILTIYLYLIAKSGLHQSFLCAVLSRCPPIIIEGFVEPKFERIQTQFLKNYKDGEEISSCVVVYHKGEKVVDLCGGLADSGEPYRTALTNLFSSFKAVCAVAIGMMVDRGHLRYEDKVADYWPEFAQGGKENVTLTDLLSHAGGLAWLDEPLLLDQLADLDLVAQRIASQKHNFNSTKKQAYHTFTYGFALNELMRRTDPKKRSLGQFIREELNQVLGTEIYLGLTSLEIEKFAKRYTVSHDQPLMRYLLRQVLRGDFGFLDMKFDMQLLDKAVQSIQVQDRTTMDYFKVEIGAGNALSNAESLARVAAAMSQKGTLHGTTIMSSETFEKSMVRLPADLDAILNINLTRTVGGFAEFNQHKHPCYGWAGYGGSLVLWDPEAQIGFGYVMNAGSPEMFDGRGAVLMSAIQEIIYKSVNQE